MCPSEMKFQKKVFKYHIGNLSQLQDQEGYSTSSYHQCLFMKNSAEFILVREDGLDICQIQQDIRWQTKQILEENSRFFNAALSQDEQTLYTCGEFLIIFTKRSNLIWYRKQQSRKLKGFKYFTQNKNFNEMDRMFEFIWDDFILSPDLIIQWNKQTRKILRQSQPKLRGQNIKKIIYSKFGNIFLCEQEGIIFICSFANGQFEIQQNLNQQDLKQIQIGNNGNLMIGLSNENLIIYQRKD